MTRQLRTRTSRPNYAALLGISAEDENSAGPSGTAEVPLDDDSGSDFAAEADAADPADEEDDMDLDDADGDFEEESPVKKRKRSAASTRENSVLDYGSASAVSKAKKVPAKATPRRSVAVLPGLSMSANRSTHALPSVHHRHRSVGVYKKEGKIERLAEPPRLFGPETTFLTNAWASNEVISSRVNKSWGYNVGPGPLWELAEDRGWFKEAGSTVKTSERELRPRVHQAVTLRPYAMFSYSEATPYLSTDVGTTEEGALKPPPPVACSFGPHGKQIHRELKMFEALKISEFLADKEAHVFNAGAPVWGLDWCPIHPDDRPHHRYKQYLAVAPFPTKAHAPMIGTRVHRPSPACIQIWSLSPSQNQRDRMAVDEAVATKEKAASAEDAGEMQCEMVLCIDSGPAYELKWCPLPSNDPTQGASDGEGAPRKLGIIGGTFEDGSLTFYAVPDPSTIGDASERSPGQPLLVKLCEPLLRIELEETSCWAFDWANSEVVAIGCTNGNIAVYNVGKALARESSDAGQPLLPTHYFTAHQSAIRSIAWVRAPVTSASGELTTDNPTVIASGGYDGVESITDIRDMSPNVINRTRDVVTALEFSTYTGSAVTIDHENMIKGFSVSPSMLGRGHAILEPDGPIWSVSASDYHPQLAVGVTDGSCITTNMMRSTRRGGLVPFLEHKIYQLDYSRSTGEYRMLENFLPQEIQNRANAVRQNKSIPGGTGAWPPEVGIHRVAWNDGNGLARTPLLASATASGLCRVDWLLGRWVRDQQPYNGIEGMRGETAGTFAEDDDESD
ncbi:hypothetical protein PYCCODRAFT_1455543 [Trametes coccinea BRFM310]|uniref:WD40 repeat-like protein n=1 Tax=Trametes coccinea (strain BRFM310) TaxID=1353009 RepID=A0A1Y2J7I6_TRAC3|nr:hypothetical protein PYCCODRAFT_1455543 [Trametes coccinea BRFM310]